ncbi:MAG: ABC transporter substrate-binding protein [Myxococcales bacterium]|nr:ABC transporter substrate-binding protein [Myxococcales bacterium]
MWISLLVSCSLTTTSPEDCESNAQCRDAFGIGWVCGEEGLCVDTPLPARCDRTIPPDLWAHRSDDYADAIVLGSVYERSESLKDVQSIELAIGQVNESEGLEGRSYALIQCSNEEDAAYDELTFDEATVAAATFLSDAVGVPAIMGPSYSSSTESVFLAVEGNGTMVISPSATSPALTALDGLAPSDADPGLLWRTAPPDSLQGQAIALDLEGRGVGKVAIIYQEGPYGEGLTEVFLEHFSGQTELLLFDTAALLATYVADTATGNADEVLFISSEKPDVVAFLNAAGPLSGYASKGIFLADAAYDAAVLDQARSAAGDLFPNIRGTRPTTPSGPVYDTFLAAYSAAYGGETAADSAYTAYAYDAAWLVVYGTAWSTYQNGDITGMGIAQGLRKVSSGQEVLVRPTSWSTVRASFDAGQSVDVVGASGTLDYDPITEETATPIDVWTVNAPGTDFKIECTFDPTGLSGLPADCLD